MPVVVWFRERGTDFARARALSAIGLTMIVLLFFGGFVGIGGEWFQMWKSVAWNGLDAALRNVLSASVPLVLIFLPASEFQRGAARIVAES